MYASVYVYVYMYVRMHFDNHLMKNILFRGQAPGYLAANGANTQEQVVFLGTGTQAENARAHARCYTRHDQDRYKQKPKTQRHERSCRVDMEGGCTFVG